MKELEISNEEVKEILKESAKNKTIHIGLFFPQDETVSKEKIFNFIQEEKMKDLLTKNFLTSFWFEVEKLSEKKKVSERDCQRIFVFCMRCFHPEIFTKMISDTPGMSNSVGYDIILISEAKTIFIDLKTKKGKKENSQIALQKEVEPYEFIEYYFLVCDIEKEIFYTV